MTDEPATTGATSDREGRPATAAGITERRSISPRVQVSWGLRIVGTALALGVVLTWIGGAVAALPRWIGAAVGLAVLLVGLPWVRLRYHVWVYEVRADSLYLERGVFTQVRTIAPFVRIQHVDTQRSLLDRWLGLSKLVVYTAGTRGADVAIPGLLPEEASDLQARVKELAIEAEGGDAV